MEVYVDICKCECLCICPMLQMRKVEFGEVKSTAPEHAAGERDQVSAELAPRSV